MDDLPALPEGMVRLGFKLIRYPDGEMVAVSNDWGCSNKSADLEEIIRTARNIVKFIRWAKRQGHDAS